MIAVGQKVRFDPFSSATGIGAETVKGSNVVGTVVFVNDKHKWFLVDYQNGNEKLKTSFKFSEIGKLVKICG